MNYVDEEMDFPWPTEPPRDSDESREKDMGSPFENQLHLTATQQQQPAIRTKKSMFKKLTGMFRSNNTSPTTPPIPLPSSSDEASAPSADSNGPIDPYANILSSAAGIPDPLLPPPPSSPFMEPRKSSSSSRSLFLNGLFTRSQETLTPPPSKKERNVLRKKGSASSLRAMRNGNGNGSTTSLAKSVKEVTKKKSGLAMEIKVPPPPILSQQRPPDLVLSPITPDYRDEDTTTSTPTPSSLPPTPTSPSSLSKSPSIRRPPRPLASLPPAPPSPTFPPPPPPPFQHSELPPRRDSLLLPPSPSSPYLSSFPQPPPSPPSVRVQQPSPEKPPSLTSSSSSSGGGVTTTAITTPSDSIDNGRGPPPHHIKSTVLPRLKDPFKQIRYRQDIEEDPELLLSDMEVEVGISRNWTTFANESTERFRAAVVEEDEEGEDGISMISNNEGGKGKKGHKIGKLSNKPTSEKPKPSLFRKRHPPSPLTLSPSLSTYSTSSALPSPLLLTPPAPHSPIRPLVQALEDIDIEDVENDTVPKGNYHYAKTTEQLLQQRGGGRVVVGRRFDL